jgi:hypothetical protein
MYVGKMTARGHNNGNCLSTDFTETAADQTSFTTDFSEQATDQTLGELHSPIECVVPPSICSICGCFRAICGKAVAVAVQKSAFV